ncbi:MAG TPA: extracellular solute-binding protein [Actinospica sp.]|nr:extracellular solute-binding protein [Actinospica sp.]
MDITRRQAIRSGLLGAAGLAVGGTVAACGGSSSSGGGSAASMTLWYWSGGLSPNVVSAATAHFKGQTKLSSSVIGGDFKQKLLTTMTSRRYVPDITGIKGEDMPSLLPDADRFVDLNTLGAAKLKSQYLSWKWAMGETTSGKLIGFPIDIGPTALFYREDLFGQAGLPTDPDTVAAQMKTWDEYFAAGVELHKAIPKTYLIDNAGDVFTVVVGQSGQRFIDSGGKFIGDGDHIRQAWQTAVKPITLGIDAKINDNSWNGNISNGTIGSVIGAAWHALDIEQAAPSLKGKWRVAANAGGPADIGGSFLAIPTTCPDPQLAFDIISWILNPANQAAGFTDEALFPSTPATYEMSALTSGDAYFGGQKTIDVFGPAAKAIPNQYTAPADAAVSAPYYNQLINVENGANADSAWNTAVSQAKQIFAQQGAS